MHQVEFWFDPICPFAWVTSRWLLEAAKVRQIEITWKQMSLAALNEGKDLDEAYRQKVQRSWGPGRVIDAVIEGEGEGALGALYTAYGMAIHEEGNEIGPKLNERALGEAGLNAQYAQEAQNEDRDEHLRARQREVEALVGNEVGTPVLGVDGRAFFGPVITRLPQGEEAGELFDAALTLGSYPYFFEMKRSRTEDPQLPVVNR